MVVRGANFGADAEANVVDAATAEGDGQNSFGARVLPGMSVLPEETEVTSPNDSRPQRAPRQIDAPTRQRRLKRTIPAGQEVRRLCVDCQSAEGIGCEEGL